MLIDIVKMLITKLHSYLAPTEGDNVPIYVLSILKKKNLRPQFIPTFLILNVYVREPCLSLYFFGWQQSIQQSYLKKKTPKTMAYLHVLLFKNVIL